MNSLVQTWRDLCQGWRRDWSTGWLSLLCGVGLLLAFSQAWEAPLFGYNGTPQSEGGLARAIYYPFYLCGLFVAVMSWRRLASAVWRTPLLVVLTLLCGLSFIWSIDPSGTLRRFIALLMTVLGGYALAVRFSWPRLSEVVGLAFVVMMVLSYVLAIAFPHMGRMQELFVGAWRGPWVEKNSLGAMMAIGFVAAAAAALNNPSRRGVWWIMAAGMAGLVFLSTSKTSLVALAVGMAGVGAIILARRGPIIAIMLTWLSLSVLLIITTFLLMEPGMVFGLLGKDATLTGRTYIWEGISSVMQGHQKLGYGYGVVWDDEASYAPLAKITQVAGFRAYHAHSCWYETWLGLGVGGFVLWALVFAETWLKALYRTARGEGGYFALPFLAIYSLSSVTESMAMIWNDIRWCLFVMVLVKLSMPGDEDA
ncbi:O-antigen ligase family protein [Asticcacaulis sp. EMRT-3]|uniref:O-antigen ligase family protein n=1 Tax=Asticcacaulis sp. EMRT-3 TaxID=3040349 RepID=UPI0024AF67EF|nr:O-antigen ligase family protein [Asticcacaulis sp. EMRT-3]MDI7774073.1 O-antigen ligase family protein [Asticcacaulis sp. EMRT-3]